MSKEPEKNLDEQLKAYAQKRRAEAGAPLEMSPATRRLLQAHVARTYLMETKPRSWFGLLSGFWPRLAFGGSIFAVLAVAALLWFGTDKTSPSRFELAQKSNQAAYPPELQEAPSPRQQTEATPQAAVSSDALLKTKETTTTEREEPPVDRASGVVRAANADKRSSEPSSREAAGTSAPLLPPPAQAQPPTPLLLTRGPTGPNRTPDATREGLLDKDARVTLSGPRAEGNPSAVDGTEHAAALTAKAVAQPGTPAAGPPPATDLSRSRPALSVSPPSQPPIPTLDPEARVALKTEQIPAQNGAGTSARIAGGLDLTTAEPGVGTVSSSGASSNKPMTARYGLAPAPSIMTSPALLTEANAEGSASRPASQVARSAGALANSERLYFSQAPARYRQNLNSPPIPNVLRSFEVRSDGTNIQVIDADGSVYQGTMQPVMAKAPGEVRTGGTGSPNQAAELERLRMRRATPQPGQVQPNNNPSQTDQTESFAFRAMGTNRSSKQTVVFTGNFQSAVNSPSAAAGSAGDGFGGGATQASLPTLAASSPSSNRALRLSNDSVSQTRVQPGAAPANASQSPPARFQNQALPGGRIEGKAVVGGNVVLPIDALRVGP